jgi:hypothetical protein
MPMVKKIVTATGFGLNNWQFPSLQLCWIKLASWQLGTC